ncbi:MAG TPA: efflux RND transporter periplasmic adaptor subunit, partial [Nevskiaceae bacterium]|nr:efflux RND transporter periplasmic adaptor subunit [Nevskiaceae bacterium]
MLLLAGCGGHAEAPPGPRPVLVEHPQPLAGEAGEAFPGTVRARVEADLSFRVPGKISKRLVDAGASVKPGQVLASLDPQDAHLNIAAAGAAVVAAEADVKLAEAQLTRQKEMIARGFASQATLDVQENQAQLARAKAGQARAQLAVVKNQAVYSDLVADRAGTITAVQAETGQVVAAGQPVFQFAAQG